MRSSGPNAMVLKNVLTKRLYIEQFLLLKLQQLLESSVSKPGKFITNKSYPLGFFFPFLFHLNPLSLSLYMYP